MPKNTAKIDYASQLLALQVELVKMQSYLIAHKKRLLVIFEGRDAAGKDGCIKRIVEYLSPRETHVIALRKPSEEEAGEWYFQRYINHLPSTGEMIFFNRSWFNRAGVEPVMGFCTTEQYQHFMKTVNSFEKILVDDGIHIIKYFLDISKNEQAERLKDRAENPLKQWKISPIDDFAQSKWQAYSKARNAMLQKTNHRAAPWAVVRANNKKLAQLNIIRDLLSQVTYPQKRRKLLALNAGVIFRWDSDQPLPKELEK